MINLVTYARTSCLPFQNQIANDEDKTAGNPTLFLRLCEVLQVSNISRSLQVFCALQVFILFFRNLFVFKKKYVRLNRLVAHVLCTPVTFQVGII